jgi:hypothetical protein
VSARCPRCGSGDVRGGKATLDHPDPAGSGWIRLSTREFGCLACGLFETRRTDDPGFGAWYVTWEPLGSEQVPPAEPDAGGPFAVPTPSAWAALLERAREDVAAAGQPPAAVAGWSPVLTLLGVAGSPGPAAALAAPPELVPFAALDGHGSGYRGDRAGDAPLTGRACLGWLVPAPELGRWDHPVGIVDAAEPATVFQLGRDTRSGIERFVKLLRRDLTARTAADTTGTAYAKVAPIHRELGRLVEILQIRRQYGVNAGPWRGALPEFEVPPGWRHERGADGVGVLAPADAFADDAAAPPDPTPHDAPAAATALLDAGAPASALLVVKNAFATSPRPDRDLGALRPAWERAYTDLGRPQLIRRLAELAGGLTTEGDDT